MLNDNAKKWVAALRSGKYEQTNSQLMKDGKYCCLGVACEVAMEEGSIGHYDGGRGSLPETVRIWLQLDTDSGRYISNLTPNTTWYLVNDNDSLGKSFSEIADIIESEPEGLFIQVAQ